MLGKGGLSDLFTDQTQQKMFLEYCKEKKIRPILSCSVIGEFVKGLPNDLVKRKKYLEKKKIVLHTLEEIDLLWVLPIQPILDLEYINLHVSSPLPAHDSLKVFSEYPLCKFAKDPHRDLYTYDQYLNYSLSPDYTSVVYGKNITKWLETEIIKDLPTIQKDHEECKAEIESQNGRVEETLPEKANMEYSPFIFLWNKLRISHYKNLNDRLDSSYAAFALAYCDYFMIDDKTPSNLVKKLKEELNLKVKIINSSLK